jgi:hypothetical protein
MRSSRILPSLLAALGFAGCGQRGTYVVICPENGSSCFPAGSRVGLLR